MLSNCLLNDKKKTRVKKFLLQKPGMQKTFQLSSRTPRIEFSVFSRTYHVTSKIRAENVKNKNKKRQL